MIEKRWDDLIQKMLQDAEKQEISELSAEPLTLSKKFDRRMRRSIRDGKMFDRREQMLRILSKAAIILVVIVATLSITYVFSPTARAMMQNIIRLIYPDHNSYRFGTQEVEVHKDDYTLGYIPEGFELVEEIEKVTGYILIYENSEGYALDFSYRGGQGRQLSIDNEHMIHEDIVINNMEGIIAYSNDDELFTVGFLVDDQIILKVTADLDKETVIKILENIQKHRK
ncbi:MAG: DUF4367 domain-containing protein [Peptostreptococcaceae bacterium]|nr:DUF4367 domain-containing protein [Peptostreptococcaceae bacterium]